MKLTLTAPCHFGLESVLKFEVERLGAEDIRVSDGRVTKIFMPSDITSIVSALGVAGEAMGIGDAEKIDKSPKVDVTIKSDPCLSDETSPEGLNAAKTTAMINAELEHKARQ